MKMRRIGLLLISSGVAVGYQLWIRFLPPIPPRLDWDSFDAVLLVWKLRVQLEIKLVPYLIFTLPSILGVIFVIAGVICLIGSRSTTNKTLDSETN
jgi:hypothetical protein